MFLMMKSDTVAWLHVLYCSLHEFTNMAALVGNILREYKTLWTCSFYAGSRGVLFSSPHKPPGVHILSIFYLTSESRHSRGPGSWHVSRLSATLRFGLPSGYRFIFTGSFGWPLSFNEPHNLVEDAGRFHENPAIMIHDHPWSLFTLFTLSVGHHAISASTFLTLAWSLRMERSRASQGWKLCGLSVSHEWKLGRRSCWGTNRGMQ